MAFSREELEKLPNRINNLFNNIKLNTLIDDTLASESTLICNILIKLKMELHTQADLATAQGQLQAAQIKLQTEKNIIHLWKILRQFNEIGKKIKKIDIQALEKAPPYISVLAQLVRPRSSERINFNTTEFKIANSPSSFIPKSGEFTHIQMMTPRNIKSIKKAIKELEEKCENYPLIVNRQPTERDKTWQTTAYGKRPPPAIIHCEKDKKLTVNNLDPNDEQMMDAYVLSIRALAAERVSQLIIKTEDLPFDLKIALIKAANRQHIATTEKIDLPDYPHQEQRKRYHLGNGIQSFQVDIDEKPALDTFPYQRIKVNK